MARSLAFSYPRLRAALRGLGMVLAFGSLVAGCATPEHMHVTEGVAPNNIDTNVRFRTTYYFRVFDYCADDPGYGAIVPQTDVLYRYRMTGKASALMNQIKFESGTLKRTEIDPFGADVVYNSDINGFLYRSQDEAQAEAKRLATRREAAADRAAAIEESRKALDRFEVLLAMYRLKQGELDKSEAKKAAAEVAGVTEEEKAKKAKDKLAAESEIKTTTEAMVVLKDGMIDAVKRYSGGLFGPVRPETEEALKNIETGIAKLQKTLDDSKGAIAAPVIEAMKTEMGKGFDDLKKALPTAPPPAAGSEAIIAAIKDQFKILREELKPVIVEGKVRCPDGEGASRGFQIMGPEGVKRFSQEDRLLMAMHSSAKPLIETLSEYSSRMLKGRPNQAEQLLPLVREMNVVLAAQGALDRAQLAAGGGEAGKLSVEEMYATVAVEFDPEAK